MGSISCALLIHLMPPHRTSVGRASRACLACRNAKARCHADAAGYACLRCRTLKLECSLANEGSEDSAASFFLPPFARQHKREDIEYRLARVERILLRAGLSTSSDEPITNGTPDQSPDDQTSKPKPPLQVIRDAVPPEPAHRLRVAEDASLIEKGILPASEAAALLAIFQNRYGRWIGLDEAGNEMNRHDFRSPLLMCAACLVSARHSEHSAGEGLEEALFTEVKSLLSGSLLRPTNNLSFFQAIVILSLWSTTIARQPLLLDAWMITGFAIQHSHVTVSHPRSR